MRLRPFDLRLRSRAFWIAVGYAVFAGLWILLSDRALGALVDDPRRLVGWSVVKGGAFVAVTAVLLWLLLRRTYGALERAFVSLQTTADRLLASEQRLTALIGSATDAVLAVDPAGRLTQFNAAAERMFGLPAAAALGEPLARFVPGELAAAPDSGAVREALRADGGRFPVEASVSAGAPWGRTLILREVAQRLAHEREIEHLNRLYSALSQINQAIVRSPTPEEVHARVCRVLVEHGGFRTAWIGWHDPSSARLFPVASAGDESGYVAGLRIFTDDRPDGRGPLANAFRAGTGYVCNDVLRDPETAPWIDAVRERGLAAVAAFPVRVDGVVQGLLVVYSEEAGYFRERELALLEEAAADLSFALERFEREAERRHAEAVAAAERQFSETMIDSTPGILYLYDERGRFLRWNRNFEIVSGYSAEEIGGMHPLEFFAAEDQTRVERRIVDVFTHGVSSVEAPFRSKDGATTPYFFTGRKVLFEGRTCLVGIGIDVSERVRAEQALRELNQTLESRVELRTAELAAAVERAEAADRLKSAFLAAMSHELRTPLNSILGFAGILLQELPGPLNAEQAKQLGIVRSSARHLLDLINDVLDLSKIEAGQLEVKQEEFAPAESLERVVAAVRPLAEAKGLALALDAGALPRRLTSDRRRVEQILLNLLNNAIKFTDRGEVRLAAEPLAAWRPAAGGAPLPAVRFRVADTGIGIRETDLARLFRPFTQLDTGLTRQHDGTGLGLAICRRLATLLGGEVAAASEFGKGSEFTLVLPAGGTR